MIGPSSWAVLAAVAAGLAVLLALPWRPRLPRSPGPRPRWAVTLAGLTGLLAPVLGALVVVGALAGAGALLLARRRTRRRGAAAVAGRVLETCDLLAAELSAGQPPGRALDKAAEGWPDLRPVAEAHGLGGDVPGALRHLAARPGAGDLRLLAAAWVVAHRTGGGLADAVHRCADTIRHHRATSRLVEGELASARATARLVAALPVLALLMGSGSGGDPLGFLLGSSAGLACLVAGLGFGFGGLWWIETIADGAT